MNDNDQLAGVDIDCDGVGDGVLDDSRGVRPNLSEFALNEFHGVCGSDGGVPIDWNRNGILGTLVSYNTNRQPRGATGSCADSTRGVLRDHNDWASLVYNTLSGGDLVEPEVIRCEPLPFEP